MIEQSGSRVGISNSLDMEFSISTGIKPSSMPLVPVIPGCTVRPPEDWLLVVTPEGLLCGSEGVWYMGGGPGYLGGGKAAGW